MTVDNSDSETFPPESSSAPESSSVVDNPADGEGIPLDGTPKPTYVKLAMRNMVRKRRQSLVHFALTAIGLLSVLVGLAYLTR